MVQADDPIYRITTEPTESLADLLQRIRQHGGRPVFLTIPTESPLFLTASEFRALRETVRSNGINFTLISEDAHRRDFARLFNLEAASEPPTHWPTSAPIAPKPDGPVAADPMEQSRQRQSNGPRIASDDPMASAPPSATAGAWGKPSAPDPASGWPTQLTPAATPEPATTTALATVPESSIAPQKTKKRKKWPWLALVALLVAAGLVAAVIGPQATITLHRQATPLTANVVFAVTPPDAQPASGAAFSVPGAWQQANVTA